MHAMFPGRGRLLLDEEARRGEISDPWLAEKAQNLKRGYKNMSAAERLWTTQITQRLQLADLTLRFEQQKGEVFVEEERVGLPEALGTGNPEPGSHNKTKGIFCVIQVQRRTVCCRSRSVPTGSLRPHAPIHTHTHKKLAAKHHSTGGFPLPAAA